MKKKVGLWIDHKRAVVIAISGEEEKMEMVISKVEKQLRRTGDSPLKGSYEPSQVPADDRQQRAFTGHINVYYDAIIASIRDAESILIFGPGEAKGELKKRLEENRLGGLIVAVEAEDRMTDRQIAAKVRQHYAEQIVQP